MDKVCVGCGTVFSGPAWKLSTRKFCTKACFYAKCVIDLRGQRFGRLTVIGAYNTRKWECLCDCGGKAMPTSQNLRLGRARSCGCLNTETRKRRKTTHGMHRSPTYVTWVSMLRRCRAKDCHKYASYGGRGIDVDPRWLSFEEFFLDMGERPAGMTIERVDNSKGYWAWNCVWATPTTQQRNIRSNRNIQFDGRIQCVSAWCSEFRVKNQRFYDLTRKGHSDEAAIAILAGITGHPA